jgi:RNA polymerase sigma-B factor
MHVFYDPHGDFDRTSVAAKFTEYGLTHDRRLRNELIEAHRSLATRLARRYQNRGVPYDDLLQVAQLGLLKAVERFDPNRNDAFGPFAIVTVGGELKRHFRDHAWAVRVPRGVKERHLRCGPTQAELSHRLRRSPTVRELSAELGCSEKLTLDALAVGAAYRTTSIDSISAEQHPRPVLERAIGSSESGYDAAELRILVAELLSSISARDRRILELRFFQDCTQSEIADIIGVSQMQVSRLLLRTLTRLRVRLEDEPKSHALSSR